MKSTAKFKVDLFKKTENGTELRDILSMNGVHKLSYSCLVYFDGCESMRHVDIAAVTMGLQHAYVPPHKQSLNEAEKLCLVTWDDAAALMLRADGISHRVFNEAVSYSLYGNLRMSTTASRGFKMPLEIIRGTVPDISKLRRFYTCSFVCIPRQKRKQLFRKGYIGRAEIGRLMAFRSPFSSTYKLLLSQNRIVHNINVTFDDSNCSEQRALPSAPLQPRQLVNVRIEQDPCSTTEEERGMSGLSPSSLSTFACAVSFSLSAQHFAVSMAFSWGLYVSTGHSSRASFTALVAVYSVLAVTLSFC